MVITGSNFGSDAATVKVFFNGMQGSVQSVSESSITAIVPAKANSGKVTVMVDTATAVGPVFTYEFAAMLQHLPGATGSADMLLSQTTFETAYSQ